MTTLSIMKMAACNGLQYVNVSSAIMAIIMAWHVSGSGRKYGNKIISMCISQHDENSM